MAYTFPNQKMVTVHREVPKTDFLGIKNERSRFFLCLLLSCSILYNHKLNAAAYFSVAIRI